jgi:hypothetical protein
VDLYTLDKKARVNAERVSKSAQYPCSVHTHETSYYHGEEEDAYVSSLRMPQSPLKRVFGRVGDASDALSSE